MFPLKPLPFLATLALATSAAASWPPEAPINATCTVEGGIKPAYGWYGVGGGMENAYQCWELCTDARRPPRCRSFSWQPSEQRWTVLCIRHGLV
ncbi:hypothetical protein EsH8_II_000465 [Colletotrichum jinshuiense]